MAGKRIKFGTGIEIGTGTVIETVTIAGGTGSGSVDVSSPWGFLLCWRGG